MNTKVIILGLVFLLSNTCFSQVDNKQFDSIFIDWNRTNAPGGAVGVVQNGKLIYSKGFGIADLEHNISIRTKTVFYLASVSKQFTAFCILLLEEKGLISLDDEVQKYLPDFPKYDTPITVSQLIHHTSGLRDYSTLIDLQGRNYLEDISEKEVYQLIKNQKSLNFKPNTEYLYSNTGYFLLSKIIEVVTKKSLKQFAKENIFQPLGMTNTTFLDDNRMLILNRAFSYEPTEDQTGFNNIIRRFDLVGSGGVYSNIDDLLLWVKNFENNILGKGKQDLIERMYKEEPLADGKRNSYAFGLENKTYRGIKRISHSGSNAGFRTFFIRFPEFNLSIVLLSNRRDGNLNKVFEIIDILLKDKLPPSTTSLNATEPKKAEMEQKNKPSVNVDFFAGKYFSSELNSYYTIAIDKNRDLFLTVNDGELTPIKVLDFVTLKTETFGTFTFKRKRNKALGFSLSIDRIKDIHFENIRDKKPSH